MPKRDPGRRTQGAGRPPGKEAHGRRMRARYRPSRVWTKTWPSEVDSREVMKRLPNPWLQGAKSEFPERLRQTPWPLVPSQIVLSTPTCREVMAESGKTPQVRGVEAGIVHAQLGQEIPFPGHGFLHGEQEHDSRSVFSKSMARMDLPVKAAENCRAPILGQPGQAGIDGYRARLSASGNANATLWLDGGELSDAISVCPPRMHLLQASASGLGPVDGGIGRFHVKTDPSASTPKESGRHAVCRAVPGGSAVPAAPFAPFTVPSDPAARARLSLPSVEAVFGFSRVVHPSRLGTADMEFRSVGDIEPAAAFGGQQAAEFGHRARSPSRILPDLSVRDGQLSPNPGIVPRLPRPVQSIG